MKFKIKRLSWMPFKTGLACDKTTKLIPTLFNKEKYVLHVRNLSLYKDLGMKLTKIHGVLQFNESPWLAKYINFKTNKRSTAKNAFEKDFFKLMNNTVFGKTLENLRKRINLKLTCKEDIYTKHASRANFIFGKMFNENSFAINRIKEELVLNRPIYVGMAILDLSKLLLYDFHYNYMLKQVAQRATIAHLSPMCQGQISFQKIQTHPSFNACSCYIKVSKGSNQKQQRKSGNTIFPL